MPERFDSYAVASQAGPLVYVPMVKILSTWRNNCGGKIYVTSDAPEVELSVNGKSLGRAKQTEFPHAPPPLFLFKVGA